MITEARTLPGAGRRNLRWLEGRIEDVELEPPYALATAGDSVHWFEWDTALPRLQSVLGEKGILAVVHRDWLREDVALERLRPIYARHSWNADFAPLDPVEELERRGLFIPLGTHVSKPAPWTPTLDEIVDCHFSMSGFARGRLSNPEAFVREVRDAVAETLEPSDDRYGLDVVATVTWGAPCNALPATP